MIAMDPPPLLAACPPGRLAVALAAFAREEAALPWTRLRAALHHGRGSLLPGGVRKPKQARARVLAPRGARGRKGGRP